MPAKMAGIVVISTSISSQSKGAGRMKMEEGREAGKYALYRNPTENAMYTQSSCAMGSRAQSAKGREGARGSWRGRASRCGPRSGTACRCACDTSVCTSWSRGRQAALCRSRLPRVRAGAGGYAGGLVRVMVNMWRGRETGTVVGEGIARKLTEENVDRNSPTWNSQHSHTHI